MTETWPSQLLRLLEENVPLVLATIVWREGSAPRSAGTRFFIRPDGTFEGTIGGGALEAQVLEWARELFGAGTARRVSVDLKGIAVEEAGMLCGGLVEIYLEYLAPGDASIRRMAEELVRIERKGGRGLLMTALAREEPRGRWILISDSDIVTEQGGPPLPFSPDTLRERFAEGRPSPGPAIVEMGGASYYVEPVEAVPRVIIFGGGHISTCLAPLAALVGFRVTVADDRPEFANSERFPQAEQVVCQPFERVFDHVDVDMHSYVVIVTRGHKHDAQVLERTVRSPARYIGMIGSRAKRRSVYQYLVGRGVSSEALERVHSPIGIGIHAETPEEIAVSIVAELIQVRGEGLGKKKTFSV